MSRIERRNREIERRQWAHTERQRTELRLKGYGEGYIQELFFGKAFSSPPEFSYSAVFDQVERPVWTNFVTSPRGSLSTGLDQYGFGNDSQSYQSTLIEDPGFESQGKYLLVDEELVAELMAGYVPVPGDPAFDPVVAATAAQIIPGTGEAFTKQHLYNEAEYQDPIPPLEGFWLPLKHVWVLMWMRATALWAPRWGDNQNDMWGPHRWLQTEDTRDRWSVTQSEHHDLGVGEEGRCSATAQIGPNGYTNWLIPISWDPDIFEWYAASGALSTITDEANAWRIAQSVKEPMNQSGNNGSLWGSVSPPHIRGFRGVAHAKVGSEATLEFSATLSVFWERNTTLTLENRNPLPASVFPDVGTTYNGQGFPYRELWEYREEYQLVSGDWSSVRIEVPQPEGRSWPAHPESLVAEGRPSGYEGVGQDSLWWTFRYRIKGTPGTTVHLDNIFMDWDWRNEEIPQLTIGVDEWIVDEAGAYIGARLWVTHGPHDDYTYRAQ